MESSLFTVPLCVNEDCQLTSCASCNCCNSHFCLDHLIDHRNQVTKPLNVMNSEVDALLKILRTQKMESLPAFKSIKEWQEVAHQTIDQLSYQLIQELVVHRVNELTNKLQKIKTDVQAAATRATIFSLDQRIKSTQEELHEFFISPVNLEPLKNDAKAVILPKTPREKRKASYLTDGDLFALKSGLGFQIFVQSPSSLQIYVVKPTDVIQTLKEKIQERVGIPAHAIRLTFIGKYLPDDLLISSSDILENSTITLNFKMLRNQEGEKSIN